MTDKFLDDPNAPRRVDPVQPDVLFVDDDAELRKMLKILLESQGYRVETAEGGMEGILKAVRFQPGLVICDIRMDGMDGIEACRQIHDRLLAENKKFVPVIMLTGETGRGSVEKAVKAGAIDYMIKPFDPDKLLEKVKTYLNPSEAARRAIQVKNVKDKLN